MKTFNFCPDSYVPETLPREGGASVMTMNGWQFSARPTTPYQRKFKLMLHGLRWHIDSQSGFYDEWRDPPKNARRLEKFYEEHEMWKPFIFYHQHLGPQPLQCRFSAPLTVPAATLNSGGLLAPLEVQIIHHNPGF